MYVAVKGGETAIDAGACWLAEERRGDPPCRNCRWSRSTSSSASRSTG